MAFDYSWSRNIKAKAPRNWICFLLLIVDKNRQREVLTCSDRHPGSPLDHRPMVLPSIVNSPSKGKILSSLFLGKIGRENKWHERPLLDFILTQNNPVVHKIPTSNMINKISSYTPSEEKHPLKTITGYDLCNWLAGKLRHKHKKHMRSFFAT